MALLTILSSISSGSKTALLLGFILVLLIASHGVVGYISYNNGVESVNTRNLKETIQTIEKNQGNLIKQQESFNKSVGDLNGKLVAHSQTVKIITNNTEREIEKFVYRDTVVPSSGMQLLADNASSLNAKRVPEISVSEVQADTTTSDE